VADQVRTPVEQSKEATSQVQQILSEIQKATNAAVMNAGQGTIVVKAGRELARKAGDMNEQLGVTVAGTASAAQHIAASAQQQSAGMDQIAIAVGETRQTTEQFAGSVRETERAVAGLSELAQRLKRLTDGSTARVS
jgi:methyl-accepting chemotaxis protein